MSKCKCCEWHVKPFEFNLIRKSGSWKRISEHLPVEYTNVLLTDGKVSWVGYLHRCHYNDCLVWWANHPDHTNRSNEYGAPYLTVVQPTHWMEIPGIEISL